MPQLFTNNASALLASSIATGATSLSVDAGFGALFPNTATGSFTITVTSADATVQEIMVVTARATDVFTVTRAQEGTAASPFTSGAAVELRLTASWLNAVAVFIVNAALAAIAALTPSAGKIPYFTSGSAAALLTLDTDVALAANSDTTLASQKAVKAYADAIIAGGVANDSITDAKLRNSAALTVIGRSANSTGDPADIAAGSDGDVLRRSGTTLGFGTLAAASIGSGQLALARGGTNADLSATGGTAQFLKQSSTGAAVTVAAIATTDIPAHAVVGTESYGDSSTKAASTAFVQAALATSVDDGNSSTADTIDFSAGNVHKSTLTGTCTYTFTAPPTGSVVILKVVQGAGPYTVTWPGAVEWPASTAPTLSTTSGHVDVFTFLWDGTNYFGVVSGQDYTP